MQTEPVINKDGSFDGVYKWEPASANRALELIGKHIGMFVEKIEHSGTIGSTSKLKDISTDKLEALLDTLGEDDEDAENHSSS